MKEAQRQWEDQRSLEQLEIYVENLKKEAMDLFDKEHYEQCLGMFRFLSELEPENHTLRDYVRLSQQMFVETIGSRAPTASEKDAFKFRSKLDEASEAPALGSLPLETHSPAHLPLAPMPQFGRKPSESDSTPVVSEPAAPKSAILEAEGIPQSVKRKIIQEYLAATTTRPSKAALEFGSDRSFVARDDARGCVFLDLLVSPRKPHRDSIDSRKGRCFHRQ